MLSFLSNLKHSDALAVDRDVQQFGVVEQRLWALWGRCSHLLLAVFEHHQEMALIFTVKYTPE